MTACPSAQHGPVLLAPRHSMRSTAPLPPKACAVSGLKVGKAGGGLLEARTCVMIVNRHTFDCVSNCAAAAAECIKDNI